MKKLLGILVLGLILFSEPANTARKSFVEGQFYEGEVNWGRGTSIILPPGKFQLLDRFDWASWGITQQGVWFVEKINGNVVHQEVSIYNVGSSKYQAYLRQWYYEFLFKNKYDGCYPRNEYTLVEVKKKGFYNCWIVIHEDIQKEIYSPDDPQDTTNYWKHGIKKYSLEYPRIMLCNVHYFFAPTVQELLTVFAHCINPDTHGASKSKFFTEESSEYHPSNIHEHPDKQKFMEEFIKIGAQQHKLFEQTMLAKEKHKMDLSEYGVGEIIKGTKTTISSSGMTEELRELYDLYKDGVLTKEEFEKAKKKVLSQ